MCSNTAPPAPAPALLPDQSPTHWSAVATSGLAAAGATHTRRPLAVAQTRPTRIVHRTVLRGPAANPPTGLHGRAGISGRMVSVYGSSSAPHILNSSPTPPSAPSVKHPLTPSLPCSSHRPHLHRPPLNAPPSLAIFSPATALHSPGWCRRPSRAAAKGPVPPCPCTPTRTPPVESRRMVGGGQTAQSFFCAPTRKAPGQPTRDAAYPARRANSRTNMLFPDLAVGHQRGNDIQCMCDDGVWGGSRCVVVLRSHPAGPTIKVSMPAACVRSMLARIASTRGVLTNPADPGTTYREGGEGEGEQASSNASTPEQQNYRPALGLWWLPVACDPHWPPRCRRVATRGCGARHDAWSEKTGCTGRPDGRRRPTCVDSLGVTLIRRLNRVTREGLD